MDHAHVSPHGHAELKKLVRRQRASDTLPADDLSLTSVRESSAITTAEAVTTATSAATVEESSTALSTTAGELDVRALAGWAAGHCDLVSRGMLRAFFLLDRWSTGSNTLQIGSWEEGGTRRGRNAGTEAWLPRCTKHRGRFLCPFLHSLLRKHLGGPVCASSRRRCLVDAPRRLGGRCTTTGGEVRRPARAPVPASRLAS
jgi:hypothetical protein